MYIDLLKTWCDGLIEHQLSGIGNENFDGGIMCPSCKLIHGRCPDAVYPMMYLANKTGEAKYMDAARKLFAWHKNLLCDDGSVYNDANSVWRGITVFSATALYEALHYHSNLLEAKEKVEWEERLKGMGNWLHDNLNESTPTNINYMATNAAALSFIGNYFNNQKFLTRARELAYFVLDRFTEDGILYGEGKPIDTITKRGCRPIDIGYNVEESVPSLLKYAIAQSDNDALKRLKTILHQQIDFFMPDGAWDNSMGSRNNKWTYWGSRTSDGCAGGYGLMHEEPIFAEVAHRNIALMARCTKNGLLYGGPDYEKAGEPPCIHHTFTHANALTAALEAGLTEPAGRTALVCDAPKPIRYFKELDTWKLAVKDMQATVTGYDFSLEAGHASGGTITLLWHKKTGPILASSMVDYWLPERLNMQLSLKTHRHRSITPRLELFKDDVRYSQCYDTGSDIKVTQAGEEIKVEVSASLVTLDQQRLERDCLCLLEYTIAADRLTIEGRVQGNSEGCKFVLPVIAPQAKVSTTPQAKTVEDIFFLSGGFTAREFVIEPDDMGCFSAVIVV